MTGAKIKPKGTRQFIFFFQKVKVAKKNKKVKQQYHGPYFPKNKFLCYTVNIIDYLKL